MSCLNLKRLLPHRRLWKVLTNKLPLKLIRSKVNKKQKHRSYKTSKKLSLPPLSIQPKKFKKHTAIHHKNHHCYSQRRPPPVFVDHLFVQPVSLVSEHVVSPGQTTKPSSSSSLNKSQNPNRTTSNDDCGESESGKEETTTNGNDVWESLVLRPESSKEETSTDGDDVWESMVLNSPQMDGIDARADEFIARFRAEMRQQEIQARRL
ncbi:hypothetical protein SASPL_111174 [Salvia splendens]|uniref:Cotton fiber protein n=1 Tax=Salvia splendens TaxID=180675 RepID=A0A8X8YBF3_SALSN|nr:hypothetical protein SASPL_111174 [Salvia splendens]